jgi:hypothetical protein
MPQLCLRSITLLAALGWGKQYEMPSEASTHRAHILVEMYECICPLSWSVHCNFVRDNKGSERGWACTPPTSLGYFFHHDGMYDRKRPFSLCVYSELPPPSEWRPAISQARLHGVPGQTSMYAGQWSMRKSVTLRLSIPVDLSAYWLSQHENQSPLDQCANLFDPNSVKASTSELFMVILVR